MLSSKPGFGLVETLVASVILATLILTFYGISAAVGNNMAISNERATAAHLAVEGLEKVRYWRDAAAKDSQVNNWSSVILANQSSPGVVNYEVIQLNGQVFTRTVTISNAAQVALPRIEAQAEDYLLVKATVTWPGRLTGNSYSATTYLTNWQQIRP